MVDKSPNLIVRIMSTRAVVQIVMVTVVFDFLSLTSAEYIDEMDSREAGRRVSLLALLCDEFHHVCKVFG
mgnify:FL=1